MFQKGLRFLLKLIGSSIAVSIFTCSWLITTIPPAQAADRQPILLAQAVPSSCATLDVGAYYRITPRHSGKSMDVFGAGYANDAKVIQWPYGGGANQQWQLKSAGNGYYNIIARHSQKKVNVSGAVPDNGGKIIQYDNGRSAANEEWCFQPAGNGYYNVTARHSQKVLDVPNRSTADGVQLQQWANGNGTNQQWSLTNVGKIPAPAAPSSKGQWSNLIPFPSIPVAAAVLPTGKVVTWSSYDRNTFVGNQGAQKTYTAIFDPQTNQVSENLVTNTQHDMFCPGTAMLSDGRLIVNGGGPTITHTSIYNPTSNSWSRDQEMNQRRWYNTTIALPNGNAFTLGGNRTAQLDGRGELWQPGQGWRTLTGALMNPLYSGNPINRAEEHPQLVVAPNGKLLAAGPTPNMQWYDLQGSGSYQSAGKRGTEFAQNSIVATYDVGKVIVAGGNPNYDGANSASTPSSTTTHVIDINGPQPQVTQVQLMRYPRAFATGVVLPNGQMLAVGGINNGKAFSDNGAILAPELFNPRNNSWTTMANMSVPRTYHSVALLLPDGRVFAGGGGLCGNCDVNHADAQIFSPPYLFKGNRPKINSAPNVVSYNQNFTVNASTDTTQFTLVRLSSVTHSVNTDQRFKRVRSTKNGSTYTLNLDANANITPPGYYMLFALNSQGVPSVSKILQVG